MFSWLELTFCPLTLLTAPVTTYLDFQIYSSLPSLIPSTCHCRFCSLGREKNIIFSYNCCPCVLADLQLDCDQSLLKWVRAEPWSPLRFGSASYRLTRPAAYLAHEGNKLKYWPFHLNQKSQWGQRVFCHQLCSGQSPVLLTFLQTRRAFVVQKAGLPRHCRNQDFPMENKWLLNPPSPSIKTRNIHKAC